MDWHVQFVGIKSESNKQLLEIIEAQIYHYLQLINSFINF